MRPNVFFSELLSQIEDEAELRVTLYVFYALGRRKGYPRFVTELINGVTYLKSQKMLTENPFGVPISRSIS